MASQRLFANGTISCCRLGVEQYYNNPIMQQSKAERRKARSNRAFANRQQPNLRRARAARRAQRAPPAPNRLRAIIGNQIDAAHKRVDMGPAGLQLTECCLNPFGYDRPNGPKSVSSIIPDGSEPGFPLTLYGNSTFSGGTATSGVIELRMPNIGGSEIAMVHYGTDAANIANIPTGTSDIVAQESTVVDAIIDSSYTDPAIRYVAGALRVTAISAPDDTAGRLDAWRTRGTTRTAVAAWGAYALACDEQMGEAQSVTNGMMARSACTLNEALHTANNDKYTNLFVFPRRPVIRFTGLAAATTLSIEVVVHIVVYGSTNYIPIAVPPSVNEPELGQILALINQSDSVTVGNSFKSFILAFWKVARGAVRFVAENPNLIGAVHKAINS